MFNNYGRKVQSLNKNASIHFNKTPNIDFYQNNMKIPSNRLTIKDIHQKKKTDYQWLQKCHDYIQWLFPTFHQSRFNINSFPLTQDQAIIFRKSIYLGQKLITSFKIYCDFIGIKVNITKTQDRISDVNKSNSKINDLKLFFSIENHERLVNAIKINIHNHLRIKRIISCLFSTGLKPIALQFVDFLIKAIDTNKIIKKDQQLCHRLILQWQNCLDYNNKQQYQINPILITQQSKRDQQNFSYQKQQTTQINEDTYKDNQFFRSNKMLEQNYITMNQVQLDKIMKQKQIKTYNDKKQQNYFDKNSQYSGFNNNKYKLQNTDVSKINFNNRPSSSGKPLLKKYEPQIYLNRRF